jgi:excisionase family DNA binding protein
MRADLSRFSPAKALPLSEADFLRGRPEGFVKSELPFDDDPFASGEASDELLTIDELAAMLKVHRSWIYLHTRKRSKTAIPHVKIGKYLRFSEADVRRFLNRLRRG